VVYAREVADTTITLIVSGKLWRNSLIMMDEQTGTLWSHVTGEGLDGELAGDYLDDLPVVQTTWSWWKEKFAETSVLKKGRDVKSSRYEAYFKDPDRAGMFRVKWLEERMPAKTKVHGIVRGPFALAIADERLTPGTVINAEVGEEPLVILRSSDGGVRAYAAGWNGENLTFEAVWEETLVVGEPSDTVEGRPVGILDTETGSVWDMDRGVCVSGELDGMQLEEVVTLVAFWFAWSNFYPKTDIID
jgi:hypothetical protein